MLIAYLNEEADANQTCRLVRATGRRCEALAGDLGDKAHARAVVTQAVATFGKIDIVVSNAAEQHPQQNLADIDAAQLERTFRTNVFAMFYLVRAALPHLHEGARIITTTSVTAFRGSGHLVDYATTKGAIVAFTRSLAQQLADKGHPGECRGAGADLDAADSVHLRCRARCQIRQRRAAGPRRPAG